mmetsp:Transcript_38421/g.121416  ORF Transcript_38421/g.121416 Transcript_38421/m.121416 type:complete len:578 (-) Transcript_38421:72-1805(-)
MGAVRWLEGRPIDARAARATRLLLLLIALTSNGSDLTSVDYALTTPPAYRFPGSWLPEPPMWSIDGARWASIILWLASVGPKGWWTRAACVLTAAAYFFMCSGIANLALMHDSFAMLQATLLVGAIFPEDDSRSSKRGDLRSTGLPRKILILFNAGAFFGTGLAALRSSGLAWFSGGSVEAWVSTDMCDKGSYACVLWPGLRGAFRSHRALRVVYCTAQAGFAMASPLALVSTFWAHVTLLAAFVVNLRDSLVFRVNRTAPCACLLLCVDWSALPRWGRHLPTPASYSAALPPPHGAERGPSPRASMLAAATGWTLVAFLATPIILGVRIWPLFQDYNLKSGQANSTHICGYLRADFDSPAGLARVSRGAFGEDSTQHSDLLVVRDRRYGSMYPNVIAERTRLCILAEGWGGGSVTNITEPQCKIHLEIGGSVYRFKKQNVPFLSARWMRDGSDTDGRARAFLEGIAPYASARLPRGMVRPGASRVALLYEFSSGQEVISSVVVPELGAEEMREYAMPPDTLFKRLRTRFLTEGPGGGTSYEGDTLWVRQVQWAGVFALAAWLARGGAASGAKDTTL